MKITSMIAIYVLFWVLSAFLVMPFGLRTHDEEGTRAETGHADSAPVNFSARRVAKRATWLAVVLFVAFYINYINGWITTDALDLTTYLKG